MTSTMKSLRLGPWPFQKLPSAIAARVALAALSLATALPAHGALFSLNPKMAVPVEWQPSFNPSEAAAAVPVIAARGDENWAVYPNIVEHVGVFRTLAYSKAARIAPCTIGLHQFFGRGHALGCFALSVTTEDPPPLMNSKEAAASGLLMGDWLTPSGSTAAAAAPGDSSPAAVPASPQMPHASAAPDGGGAGISALGDAPRLAGRVLPPSPLDIDQITKPDALAPADGAPGLEDFVNNQFAGPDSTPPLTEDTVIQEFRTLATLSMPEPGTLCLWAGLGFAAVGTSFLRRRHKRTSQPAAAPSRMSPPGRP